jgi:ABC-type glycerol-3-phosphate transport system substrate-binding protein
MQRRNSIVVLFATLFAGCQAVLPPPADPPHKGTTVRVACPVGLGELVATQSLAWQSQQQAQVAIKEYDLARGPASVAQADVWLVAPADLPHWARADKLVPLSGSFTVPRGVFEWSTLLPAYREQLLRWDARSFAVPLAGEAPVCVYRSDLYAKADLQKRYRAFQQARQAGAGSLPLQAPATWEEFALQAEFFSRHPASGKPGPSLPPLPADEAALDRLFYSVAAPHARRAVSREQAVNQDHLAEVFAFHYDLKTGKARVAGPGFVAALELLQRLQACRPSKAHPQPAEAILAGQAVLGVVEASWLVKFQQKPELRDRIGVCQVPGTDRYFTPQGKQVTPKQTSNRVPYLGGAGWLACVPRTSSQAEAAFDLLADLAGPARSNQAALEPRWGGPVRTNQVIRENWSAYDLDRSRSQALHDALSRTLYLHNIKNPVLCLRIPDQAEHRAAMVAGLRKALLENAKAAEVLAEVARTWEALDAKNRDHLSEYRISLGLLGK